jgi:histidine triad (HIT) family protein
MDDCVFCKIIKGEVPADFIYQDEEVVAFKDIKPKAPVHLLIIPKRHIERLDDAQVTDRPLLGKLLLVAKQIAQEQGVDRSGYRLVINNGESAGQMVPHLHIHLLGGKNFE